MRYGTLVKSAVVDRNVTRRVPESMSEPKVGHPLAGNEADGGLYDSASAPAVLKAASNWLGARLSELTIRIVTTNQRLSDALCLCIHNEDLPSFGLASIQDLTL